MRVHLECSFFPVCARCNISPGNKSPRHYSITGNQPVAKMKEKSHFQETIIAIAMINCITLFHLSRAGERNNAYRAEFFFYVIILYACR